MAEGRQLGCLALTGRCYETEGTPPFIPWVEMIERSAAIVPKAAFREALGDAAPEVAKLVPELRRTFPDIPAPIELPPEQQRRYLFNSFLDFIKRGTQVTPQVVLLDDLHWADDSTLLLLQHVAQHASEIPLLIVGTYRDVDLEVARPFAKTLEGFTRHRLAHKVALRRLPESEVSDMLQVLSGQAPPSDLVGAIYDETEGNPFFIEEVFQHLSEEGRLFDDDGHWRADLRVEDLEVPEGVRLVIGRRVERLSLVAHQVLTSAAIVGRSFDFALLESVGDAEGDVLLTAIEEAEAAKLIQTVSSSREPRWEFAHGLIRQTLESSLSLPRRQRAHLRVAEAMERVSGAHPERVASDMARHLYLAGVAANPDKTVRFLMLAGDQALDAGGFDEALRQFDDALSLIDNADQRRLSDLRFKKGQALRSDGRAAEAVAEWQKALVGFAALEDNAAIARTAYLATYAQSWNGDFEAATRQIEAGLGLLGDSADAERCHLQAMAGWSLSLAGQPGGAELIEQSVAWAEAHGDERLLAEVLQQSGWHHHHRLQPREGLSTLRRAEAFLRSTSRLYDLADVLSCVVLLETYSGRLNKAAAVSDELESLSARAGHLGGDYWGRTCQVWGRILSEGNLKAGERLVRDEADRECQGRFVGRGIALHLLGTVLMWRAKWSEAEQVYRDAERLLPGTFWTSASSSSRFLIRAQRGDANAARVLRQTDLTALVSEKQQHFGAWEHLMTHIEALATVGDDADSARLYPVVLKGLSHGVVISTNSRLWQMIAGIAAACGQHWDTAQEHYEIALKQAHDLPHKIAQPEVRRWYAQMLLNRNAPGDRDKARTLLGEAIDQYRTIGMPKHLAMAEGMLKGV